MKTALSKHQITAYVDMWMPDGNRSTRGTSEGVKAPGITPTFSLRKPNSSFSWGLLELQSFGCTHPNQSFDSHTSFPGRESVKLVPGCLERLVAHLPLGLSLPSGITTCVLFPCNVTCVPSSPTTQENPSSHVINAIKGMCF